VKERWLTLLLAAGALVMFYGLMFPKAQPDFQKPSQPLSNDDRSDGEQALWQWLRAEHIPVSSLRYRYGHLGSLADVPMSTGNVMITVMPHQLPIRKEEWQPIRQWIEAGNTLLVLAALDDTPAWCVGAHDEFLPELRQLVHLSFGVAPRDKDAAPIDDRKGLQSLLGNDVIQVDRRGDHPLTSGVPTIRGFSALPAARWMAQPIRSSMPLVLLQRRDSGAPAVWLLSEGLGQVIVSSLASPFANGQIDQPGNAQFVANIIAWSRSTRGSVIFDDAHQGLTAYYDPRAFFGDPRLHRTLAWAVLLWLAFVLGPLPLRNAYSLWRPVDETALIEASARFYSVAVLRPEVANRLFENFFNRLRRRLSLPQSGVPLWEWLRAQSRLSTVEREQLQSLYARTYAGERVDLKRLQNLLSIIQGKIA
jgi:hypothetical protein